MDECPLVGRVTFRPTILSKEEGLEKILCTPQDLMHDNDPKHTARRVKAFMLERGIHLLPYWPAQSPDLNPIDVRDRRPQSKAELF